MLRLPHWCDFDKGTMDWMMAMVESKKREKKKAKGKKRER